MGCGHSSPAGPGAAKAGGKSPRSRGGAPSPLEARMQAAIKAIMTHMEASGRADHVTFTRIILKFPALRAAFTSIRTVFKRFDTDGACVGC
jgi:hypothetical protein